MSFTLVFKLLLADFCSPRKTASIGSTVRPSLFQRSKSVTRHLEAALVRGIACNVGKALVPLVGVALFAIGEVLEVVDDDGGCVGWEDGLVVFSANEEPSLDDAATADESSTLLQSSFGSPAQDWH